MVFSTCLSELVVGETYGLQQLYQATNYTLQMRAPTITKWLGDEGSYEQA